MIAETNAHEHRTVTEALSIPIDVISLTAATARIMQWARSNVSRYVVLANAHVVVTANRDLTFGKAVRLADMAAPDGAPVAWMLRAFGNQGQNRVCGPDLMWKLLESCAQTGVSVYFYGSSQNTLDKLSTRIINEWPSLNIAGAESPPFRELTAEEVTSNIDRINTSKPGILFVGLGCPKQEKWMLQHKGKINSVMLGVGAAFDFHAGTVQRAPIWMRNNGLEWAHRLYTEPRRLWKRYVFTNTLFLLLAVKALVKR